MPGQSPDGGFVLHNTHSLPIRFEDIEITGSWPRHLQRSPIEWPISLPMSSLLGRPGRARSLPPAQPRRGIRRARPGSATCPPRGATRIEQIPERTWQPARPAQPWLPYAWDAPFLYEDRRHLFHVTTTESLVPIRWFTGFGVLSASPGVLSSGLAISRSYWASR